MVPDPTRRFSSRVSDYTRYRPSYPPQVLHWLERECGLHPQAVVADIGSGTGLLAGLFLDFGCRVIGVEPNPEMRHAGEQMLAGYPRFRSVDARAEATGLPDASVDLISAGQSFHWFDQEPTRHEFRRIAKPTAWVALIWNERTVRGPFLETYEALMQRYSPDYSQVDHRRVDDKAMDRFFGKGAWRLAAFPNAQQFDLGGLMGRVRSSSYAPATGSPEYETLKDLITRLFEESNENGLVEIRYETKMYVGRPAEAA